jgi:hypothetical protein
MSCSITKELIEKTIAFPEDSCPGLKRGNKKYKPMDHTFSFEGTILDTMILWYDFC